MGPDKYLYHYTTVEAFENIVKGGELWASHIRCLNDTSEQRLLWGCVQARIGARLDTANGDERSKLLRFKSLASSPQDIDIYLLCFSRDGGDRLSQWRGYGGNGGVAIGFDSAELKERCQAFTKAKSGNQPHRVFLAYLDEVKYIQPSGDDRFNGVIDTFLDCPFPTLPETLRSQEEMFSRTVSFTAAGLKHKAFEEELEWRIHIYDVPDESVRFRPRRSMLVPYVPFDLGFDGRICPLIKRIVVGPNPHQAEVIAAIKKMTGGVRAPVEGSTIPYRDC